MAGICLSSAAMAQNQTSPDAAIPFTPVFTSPTSGTGSYLAFGSQIGTLIDVSTPSNDFNIRGVEPAYGYFYVSGSNAGATPIGLIYQFDTAGALLNSFLQNQPATNLSQIGHRDLASDGDGPKFSQAPVNGRLWGGQENSHWVRYTISANGSLDAGTVLPQVPGVKTMSALAYLGGPTGTFVDRLVTFNVQGTASNIVEFDEAGSVVATFPSSRRYTGFALNPSDPNVIWGASAQNIGPCSVGTNVNVRILELDRSLGYAPTGNEFCGAVPGEAGGMGVFDGGTVGINSGFYTLAVIHQVAAATGIDSIGLYDTAEASNATPSVSFCTAKTTSVCGPAAMTVGGTSSATANSGFVLSYGPTRGCRAGLILYTNQGLVSGAPFGGPGNGVLCLQPQGLRRAGPIDAGGTSPAACDGNMSMDFNAFAQGVHAAVGCNPAAGQNNAPNFLRVPGTTVWAQGWGRDSVPTGQVLSDGRAWVVGP